MQSGLSVWVSARDQERDLAESILTDLAFLFCHVTAARSKVIVSWHVDIKSHNLGQLFHEAVVVSHNFWPVKAQWALPRHDRPSSWCVFASAWQTPWA